MRLSAANEPQSSDPALVRRIHELFATQIATEYWSYLHPQRVESTAQHSVLHSTGRRFADSPLQFIRGTTIPERSPIASFPPVLPVPRSTPVQHVAGSALQPAQVIRGRGPVLERAPLVRRLAALAGQAGQAADLAYFMALPDNASKVPCLLLLPAQPGEPSLEGFAGAVLLFEYRTFLGRTGLYSTADTTGRRTVFAPPEHRARVATRAAQALLAAGAHLIHIAFHQQAQDATLPGQLAAEFTSHPQPDRAAWAVSQRTVPLYLPLAATFDQTVARIGQRTRSNLRYYRRRTERDLGCHFIPAARLTLADFLAFNQQCMYAVPEPVARFRYGSISMLERPVFCGIQDRSGRWLSLIGGRRRHAAARQEIEIDWQMNRDGLAPYSLSTAMRACLIQHEITLGTQRLYIEGGTPHPIGRSFQQESAAELTVRRRTACAFLLTAISRRTRLRVYLAQVLRDPTLLWHRC